MTVHLYMGQEFDHTHEMHAFRKFVGEMQERYGASDEYYFIFANYFISGREIDLTVLKKNAIIVVELKECGGSPITGAENGDWVIHNPNGTQTPMNPDRKNPYWQVKGYRFAWMDLLRERGSDFLPEQKVSQMDRRHVSAFVTISPELDPSSEIDIGYQPWFRVVGLDELCHAVHDQRTPALSFTQDELVALAEHVLVLKRHDIQKFLGPIAPELPLPIVKPETLVPAEQWRAYCQTLIEDHPKWTELLVLPPEALNLAPARLVPAEKADRFPAVSAFRVATPIPERSPVSLDSCVRSARGPLVVLGGPGQGKTVALELLSIVYARAVVEGTAELVPVLVKLGRYNHRKRDLRSLIAMSLRARGLEADGQETEFLLGDAGMPLLLMLDGLDEVQASERLNAKQDIESLLLSYPFQKAIITCRTAEYDDFGLRLEGEERWELCGFDDRDIRRFLIDYYWDTERTPQKGRLLLERLQQQGLMDFAQTPLHLGLILGLAQEQEGLPKNRGELYRQFTDMVLRLETGKGKAPAEWTQIERFLAHLALVMHEGETRQISWRTARQAIGQYWRELWDSGTCSLRLDDVFDLVWKSRLAVTTDRDIGFRHAVLQDYFAAKRLEYMIGDAEEDLYRYVGDPHWDEAFALLAGMVQDASELVHFVSRRGSPLLTMKCLANARRMDGFAMMIAVEHLLDQLFDPQILEQHASRLIAEAPSVLRSAKELQAYLATVWADRLVSAELVDQDLLVFLYGFCTGAHDERALMAALEKAETEEERVRSATLLGFLGSADCMTSLIDCLYDENADLRRSAIESLGRIGDPKAIDALQPHLSDKDSDVRRATIASLGALCGAEVSPPPTSFLEYITPFTSDQEIDDKVLKEVKAWLQPSLSDPDIQVRTEAAIVLGCLGQTEVSAQLIWLLTGDEFDEYQKGRVLRALGCIGTSQATDAVTEFYFDSPVYAERPIHFEITAALIRHCTGWMGPLLESVGRWSTESLADSKGSEDRVASNQWYRLDRLRWYRETLAPAIVGMGMSVLDDLFECIGAAEDGLYPEAVGEEAERLLERIRKSADIDELIRYLGDAARQGRQAEVSWGRDSIENAIYLIGEHCAGLLPSEDDPLLSALRENRQLVQLFEDVYQQAKWDEVRMIAARILAHYVRLVGRDTLVGAAIYQGVMEPWIEEGEADEEHDLLRRGMILSMCGDAQAIPLLLGFLEAQEVETQYQAALLLLEYHRDERAMGLMIDALHQGDTNWRSLAARALENFDDPKATTAFVDALHDPESHVRLVAVRVLAKRGDESVIDALSRVLNDEDSWIRDQTIRALGKIGGRRAVESLSDVVLYDADGEIRRSALEALASIGDPAGLGAFRRALTDEDSGTRDQAIRAVGKVGGRQAVEVLSDVVIHHDDSDARRAALRTLAIIGDVGGLDAFRHALKDGDSSVEFAASSGLESWGSREDNVSHLLQIYAVMKESESTHSEMRRVSLIVRLGNIGTSEAIRAVEDFLQDPDEMVRYIAIAFLQENGTADSLAALRRMAAEDTGIFADKVLADVAREAIEKIQEREQKHKE